MKIAFMGIKGLPSRGGAERVVEAVVQRLAMRHELTVYCSTSYTPAETRVPGSRLIRLPSLRGRYSYMTTFDFLAAWHALTVGNYDLVHLHNMEASFVLPMLRLKYKVISTAHGRITSANKWGRLSTALLQSMETPFGSFSNALTSVSLHDAQDLQKKFRRPVRYIPNGVDRQPQVDLETARRILEAQNLEAGNYLMFAAGRIIPLKGAHLLLKALDKIGRDFRLIIVGDMTHSQNYARHLQSLLDERTVHIPFLASRAVLLGLAQLSSLFVFPSMLEAMSTMLLEAASVAAPLVYSDIPGNLAVLPRQGLRFISGDVEDLCAKLIWGLDHPVEMKGYGLEAKAQVQAHFNWDHIVEQYNYLYEEIIPTT